MSVVVKFMIVSGLIVLATACGYLCRRRGYVPQKAAASLMTLVVVGGFTVLGFLSVWKLPLRGTDFWLTMLGVAHVIVMTLIGMAASRLLTPDVPQRGTFAVTAGFGNNGFTMGGFVAYLLCPSMGLAPDMGLGLAAIYTMMAVPLTVLWFYPIARHFSGAAAGKPLGLLMRQSLLDWRSLGLPAILIAILLSVCNVPYPAAIDQARVTDILIFATSALAYFAVGLRLELSRIAAMGRMIAALGILRFIIGPAVALGLLGLASLTPWPVEPVRQNIFMILTVVPTAVVSVAVCNMFDLRPREASVLFVANTLLYLLIVLPILICIYR